MPTFTELRNGSILGIVDPNGAVHSRFISDREMDSGIAPSHEEIWPTRTHGRWRWSYDQCIHWFISEQRPDPEHIGAIEQHLAKRYDIQFWENGYHDLDHFSSKLTSEKY